MTGLCLSSFNMDSVCGTTRRDRVPDTGIIDMGYHYPLEGLHIPPGSLLEENPAN